MAALMHGKKWRWGLLLAAWLWLSLSAQALVFTLRPGNGAGSVEEALESKEVLNETLEVNGAAGTYTVSTSDLKIDDALTVLKPLIGDWKASKGQRSVLIEVPSEGKWLTRYYVVSVGEHLQTVIFRLNLPRDAAEKSGFDQWPKVLPRPSADTFGAVMKLGKRNTTYATFSSRVQREVVVREYHGLLRRDGWSALGGADTSGGVYVDSENRYMAVLCLMDGRKGMTKGAVLLTPYGPSDRR